MAKFGGVVTIKRQITGVYNPTTGTATTTAAETTIRGVLQAVNQRSVTDMVRTTDKVLLIAAADVTTAPTTDDEVIIGGVTHQVITVDTIEQDSIPITYELVLRG